VFLSINDKLDFLNGNTWMINQWSKGPHPDHFTFKMLPTGIIFGKRELFGLPKLFDRIYFQDYLSTNLTDFERNIFDLSMSHKKVDVKMMLFSKNREKYCLSNTFTSQTLQQHAKNSAELDFFHKAAEVKMSLKNLVYSTAIKSCPPVKAMLMERRDMQHQRRIIDSSFIKQFLAKSNITLDYVFISSKNSSKEQAIAFNSYGLIISPHSSQLTNLLFAQKNTVVLIVAPFLFEHVFYNLAKLNNLRPIISDGHNTTCKKLQYSSCLKKKVFLDRTCHKTWREVLSCDTIIDKTILSKHLQESVNFLLNCK
jgi:hypothetical protein